MSETSGREFLTAEEALAMLPDGDTVHVFSNPGLGMLLGADWDRSDVESLLRTGKPERAGGMAAGMGHGIAVLDGERRLFVATRK